MSRILKYSGKTFSEGKVEIPDVKAEVFEVESFDEEEIIEVPLTPVELAEIEAKELMDNAKQYYDDLINKAKLEYDEICQSAMKQGYDEAFQSQLEDITACLKHSEKTLSDMKLAYAAFMKEYTAKLPSFALEIASSILKTKLKVDPLVMCDLVEDIMSNIRDTSWATVTLSKELVALVELLQSELPAKCPTIANLEIKGGELPIGSCVIDSIGGIIDASINEQIYNLSKRFEQVMDKRK